MTNPQLTEKDGRVLITRFLNFLNPNGNAFELCAIGPKSRKSNHWEGYANGSKPIVAGWFSDHSKAADIAQKLDQIGAMGIFVTLNPCNPALCARANHRLKAGVSRTADAEIIMIKHLLIDVDPRRPKGISSTAEEHAAALEHIEQIKSDMMAKGWPEPLVGDSGNGGHLIFKLPDLEPSGENIDLLKKCLKAFAQKYNNDKLDIDQKVFNPARLNKIYGTHARKGDNTVERPHRLAQIISLPESPECVSVEQLEALAGTVNEEPRAQCNRPLRSDNTDRRFSLKAYLEYYGVELKKTKEHYGADLYVLQECRFDSSHRGGEAAIGQTADGILFYQCFHASCAGRTWHEARTLISGDDSLAQFCEGLPRKRKKRNKRSGKKSASIMACGFNLTDMGNAERLVEQHGQDLRYCHLWKLWLIWDGRRWVQDITAEIKRKAKAVVRNIYGEAKNSTDEKARALLAKHAVRSESDAKIKAMISLAESESGIPVTPDELDTNPMLLCCLNGIIDLRTGELREHKKGDLITKISPVTYDTQATCPTWDQFLNRIMDGNERLIEFLQRIIGYSLTGDTSEQCLFFMYGTGANGKSTFLSVISDLLGDYAKQTDFTTFMQQKHDSVRNDLARLKGARLVSSVEVESGKQLAEVVVKQITGGDVIVARFLHREFFEFSPTFKIFIAANHKPAIWGTDHAIWRRIHLVPFTVTIPPEEQDKKLPEKIKLEMMGIFRWAIEGCLKWQRNGLDVPQEVEAATEDYREEMDILGGFLRDSCVLEPGHSVRAKDLYQKYTDWCESNGESAVKQRTFGRKLKERGLKNKKSTGGFVWWFGIGIVDEVDDSDKSSTF